MTCKDSMTFPATFEEFAEKYKIVDSKEVYTNGTELIPIFRVKQWLEHKSAEVKHGKWKVKRDDYDTQLIKCSVCKEEFYPPDNCFDFDFMPNYCGNCGAKMDGRKDDKLT